MVLQENENGLKQAVSGIARLYGYLSHVKNFPTSLRFAAVVSGLSDEDVRQILSNSPYFLVSGDSIDICHQEGGLKVEKTDLDDVDAYKLDKIYKEIGIAALCEDGHVIAIFSEEVNG